jgi:ribonuclease BN (tRNA processing enzyme)
VPVEARLGDDDADRPFHAAKYRKLPAAPGREESVAPRRRAPDNPAVQLTVIGSSPAWPNPGSVHSGYLLEDGRRRLLLDCGPGVLGRLREWNLLPVDAIAITHFHLDHFGDLVPWCWFTAHGLAAGPPPTLFVPPGGSEVLEGVAGVWGHERMFDGVFDVREYEPEAPFDAAGFTVEAHAVDHYGMTAFGFRVADGAGRLLAYSGDTGPCDGLRRVASGASLFLCEATLESAADDPPNRGHLAGDEAAAFATGPALLTHRPAELETPPGVERAADGTTYRV